MNTEENQIDYSDIMELGFTEKKVNDIIYFDKCGYEYSIIQKRLTKKIYLEWKKETRICKIVRLKSVKTGIIASTLELNDAKTAKQLIDFFTKNQMK
jgi:hypothetical protein